MVRELRADDLEREAIDAARKRPPSEKLRDGLRLFDRTCQIMTAGIRAEQASSEPTDVLRRLRARLRLARDLERR